MANNSFYSPMDPVSINFGIPVDRSGLVHAQAMSDAGDTAKNMLDVFGKYKKGVTLNEIDADYEKAINDYYSQSPTYQNLLNKQIKNFEDQLKTPTMDTNIQRITADLDEARAKLSKARDQGTITPLELETRLDQLTREKVAANPAFRNEIISHAAQTKDMLGISQIMANDTKIYNDIIQAEKEARQQMERDVNTYHINLNDAKFKNLDGSINRNAVNFEINEKRGKIGEFEAAQNLYNIADVRNKITKEDILNSGTHRKAFEGLLLKSQIELGKIWDDPNLDINQKIKSADAYLIDRKQDLVTLLGRWNNDKDLSYIKDDFNSITQHLQENYKSIKNGKEMKDFLENQMGIIKAKQEIGLNNVVNTTEMRFLAEISGKMPNAMPQNMITQFQKDMVMLASAFTQSNTIHILNVNPDTMRRVFSTKVGTTKVEADLLLESAHDTLLKDSQGKDLDTNTSLYQEKVKNYENVLRLFTKHANESEDPKQALYAHDKVYQNLGESQIRSKGLPFTDAFKSEIDQSIITYADKVNKEIQNLRGKPDGVILSMNPDGTLIARKDPSLKVTNEALQQQYITKFNSVIVSRINNSMKAYATVHNTTTQAISDKFIQQYYGPMFSNLASGNQKPAEPTFTPSETQKKANDILGI